MELFRELLSFIKLIPAQSASVAFFVWEKISNTPPTPTAELDEPAEVESLLNDPSTNNTERSGPCSEEQSDGSSVVSHHECIERTETLSENQLKAFTTLTRIFREVYKREMKKSGMYFSLSNVNELSTFHSTFNAAHVRSAYMYRYATCHTILIKDCVTKFLVECPKAEELVQKWRPNSNLCSLSFGPALDYVAFSLAVLDHTKEQFGFIQVNILTTCMGWSDTFDVLAEVMLEDKTIPDLNFFAPSFWKGDVFGRWGSRAVNCLLGANVLFMFKALDLNERVKSINTRHLQELVRILKVGTVIFFIDTSQSSKFMQDVLSRHSGIYLYGPIPVACIDTPVKLPTKIKKLLEEFPVQSSMMDFFVWEKHSNITPVPSISNHHLKTNIRPFQIQSSDSCASFPRFIFPEENLPRFYQKITSDSGVSSFPFESSESPPNLNPMVVVENQNKTLDYWSPKRSESLAKASTDQRKKCSKSLYTSKQCATKQKPVVSKTIMRLKKLMESSEISEAPGVVKNLIVTDEPKTMLVSVNNGQSISEDHPTFLNLAGTELSSQNEPTKETSPSFEVDKIDSIITRIDKLASFLENNYDVPSHVNEGLVNVTEISQLTKRIGELVTTLERRQGHSDETGLRSCGTKCSLPLPKNCDIDGKSSASLLNCAPCSERSSSVQKSDSNPVEDEVQRCRSSECHCLGNKPSIVIPLKDITPDMLSLIRSSKK